MRSENSRRELEFYSMLFRSIDLGEERTVLLDVGANVGYSSMKFDAASHVWKKFRPSLICVEPNYRNFPYLVRNLNKVDGWGLLPFALHSRNGFLPGGVPERYRYRGRLAFRNSGLFSTVEGITFNADTAALVPALHASVLREFVGKRRVAFCKIDIEGSEMIFLRDAGDWLFGGSAIIQMEMNPAFQSPSTDSELRNIVQTQNYEVLVAPDADLTANHERFLVPMEVSELLQKNCSLVPIEHLLSL